MIPAMSTRACPPGTKVKLDPRAFETRIRLHLGVHARAAHVGTVIAPLRPPDNLWIILKFPDCPKTHRVTREEIVRL